MDRFSVDWIVQRIRGNAVAVVGRVDSALLAALSENDVEVQLHGEYPSSSDRVADAVPESPRESIKVLPLQMTQSGEQASATADTVVVLGWPEASEPHELLQYVVRIGKKAARLIFVWAEFAAGRDGEPDLAGVLDALRQHVAPEHLSIEADQLRFVGRTAKPSADEWRRFESEYWPDAVDRLIRAMQVRHRAELDGLRGRIGKLQALTESVSFRLGETLVSGARSPRTVWRLPVRLWRFYRSVRPRRSRRRVGRRTLLPPFKIPDPNSVGLPVVAAVLDTFSEYCLRYEAALVLLTPRNWREEMDRSKPALLFVESAWLGNDGAWHRLIADNWKLADNPLQDLLSYCRSHGIPSVFWNKEDPPSFDTFIDAAKGFDVVLTTDEDCIAKYKTVCGHERVYAMPFAAQPKLHNPRREAEWPTHRVAFAGSWASRKTRAESLGNLLDAALPFGLHIFDRNLDREDLGSRALALRFPDRYRSAIKGSLDYPRMLTAYRCYDVLLNANSVTNSPTMFSRRVFECLASGTPVVSGESVGMRRILGNHVRVARNSDEASSHLRALFDDEEARAREGHLAYRFVHENHTYGHRMADSMRWAGVPQSEDATIAVSILIVAHEQKLALRAIGAFARQSYKDKELLLVLNGSSFDLEVIGEHTRGLNDVQVLNIGGKMPVGGCLNRGIELGSGEFVAALDDDCLYGDRYIADMMLAANFADAEILGKGTYYVYSDNSKLALDSIRPEHQVTDSIIGSTLIARRDVLSRFAFEDRLEGTRSDFLRRASEAGCRIYSADRFNHVVVNCAAPAGLERAEDKQNLLSRLAAQADLSRAFI